MKAHNIKQILLKDGVIQIESTTDVIEQYTLTKIEKSMNSYKAVMRPRKFKQDTILSANINDVTEMKSHFSKGLDLGNIIKVIYDEDKSRFFIIKQEYREVII